MTSGIASGLRSGLVTFLLYKNELTDYIEIDGDSNTYAYDVKILRHIHNEKFRIGSSKRMLTIYLNGSRCGKKEFCGGKCHVVKCEESRKRPQMKYKAGKISINGSDKKENILQ